MKKLTKVVTKPDLTPHQRLALLETLLRQQELWETTFHWDFTYFTNITENSPDDFCGTAGCAIGLGIHTGLLQRPPMDYGLDPFHFFGPQLGIDNPRTWNYLFAEPGAGEVLMSDVTPGSVAARIGLYLESL